MNFPELHPRDRSIGVLLTLGAVGYLARLLFALYSVGSNDIETWERFARQIHATGLLDQYVTAADFNHPPLMGLLAHATWLLSQATGVRFSLLFKLPAIAADIGTGVVLGAFWSRLESARRGALVFALYAWNPLSFLMSAHHGNTDCICTLCLMLALYMAQVRGSHFGAGAALGAAINVKLIPIICLPALLLTTARNRRDLQRFGLGLGLALLPFVVPMVTVPLDFLHRTVAYYPRAVDWGIPLLLKAASDVSPGRVISALMRWYAALGRVLIIASIAACTLAFGPTRKLSTAALIALTFALFLCWAPGFGVQYLVYVLPALFAVSPWLGLRYACLAGYFVGSVYLSFWDGSRPYFTLFTGPFPPETMPFGLLTWLLLGSTALQLLTQARACPAIADPYRPWQTRPQPNETKADCASRVP